MIYDVITIGGATLDIFLDVADANKRFKVLHTQDKDWLAVPYGGKVSVDALHFDVGGNAANIAVGLARLGLSVATHVHFGSDEISQKIVNRFKAEGVAIDYLVQDKDQPSPVSVIINFAGERTIFVHHITRKHQLPNISAPKWIYLTSIGNYWEDLYKQVREFVRQNNVLLAFNPGTHQIQSGGVEGFLQEMEVAAALFVNKEEGKLIAKTTSDDVKTLLVQLQSMGPKIVSITDGSNGAYAIDGQGQALSIPVFTKEIVERTGAGDAYASGFLAALVNDLPVAEAMGWGAANAAAVVSTVGAEKGLLKKTDLENKLSENPDFKANSL